MVESGLRSVKVEDGRWCRNALLSSRSFAGSDGWGMEGHVIAELLGPPRLAELRTCTAVGQRKQDGEAAEACHLL